METTMQISLTASQTIDTTIQLPASKSISNRALIIHALSGGQDPIHNLSDCDDTQVMIRALRSSATEVDIMAAGTAMRFLTAYYAATEGEHILTGTNRMRQRPIRLLVDALRSLGASIHYVNKEGYPPLRIKGERLTGGSVSLPGDVSSQYISALLMIGPILNEGLTLRLGGEVISKPYINLTLHLMRTFGARVEWINDGELQVFPTGYRSAPFTVESDWSAASYWYQIIALCKDREACVRLTGLYTDSAQGDSAVADIFRQLGVKTTFGKEEVVLQKEGSVVHRMEYDFIDQPDLAQTFAVTCCMLNVPFRFFGLQSLRIKETDRMRALITECAKLGYVLNETEGSILSWEGERIPPLCDPVIDTYEDHRMAMAFAPAALQIGNIRINEPGVVSKSYPNYWEDLARAGFKE